MASQKPPGEDKDSEPAADGAAASEEPGAPEPELPSPHVGEASVPSPGSPRLQGPRRDCSEGPARRCALCNCGEPSLHGQRELRRVELPCDWPRCPVVSPGGTRGPVRTCHRLVSLRALHLPTWENLEGSAGLTIGVLRGQQACGGRMAQNYVVWTRPSSQGSHSAAPTAPGSVPPSLAARPVVHGFTTSPVQLPVALSCP